MNPHRHPLVVVLTAAAAGMVADRYRPLAVPVWCVVAAVALGLWFTLRRKRKNAPAAISLLVAVAGLAAAWHHDRWNIFGADDLGLFTTARQQPVCIEAVALQTPRAVPQPEFSPLRISRPGEEVRFEIELRAIRDGDQWRSASGRAGVAVDGPLPELAAGDRFQAFGHLLPPERPLNPGEPDRAAQDRGRRITGALRVTYPEAITVLSGSRFGLGPCLESLRLRGRRVFERYLQPRQAALAAAVLLGLREQLDTDETEAFQLTGTVHLLVIAGFHLGIIALIASMVFRRLLPGRFALPATAAFALLYMLLVDAQPPIVRATVLIVAACAAVLIGRRRISFNTLALAGLIVLAVNPNDLFNVGPQLSFLCVAGLMAMGPGWFIDAQEVGSLDGTKPNLPSPSGRGAGGEGGHELPLTWPSPGGRGGSLRFAVGCRTGLCLSRSRRQLRSCWSSSGRGLFACFGSRPVSCAG